MTPKEHRDWHETIRAGVRAGIADAVRRHKKAGRKVPVWSKGRVVWMTVDAALADLRKEIAANR